MTSQQARLHESEGNLQQLANAIKESVVFYNKLSLH
jgi:hypothetical protein